MLALASIALPPPRQQPLDAVSLKAAAAPRRGASGIIVCVSVPPYDNAEQDQWCQANNNEGKLCGPEAWSPPGEPGCLSKTCRCADSDDVQAAPGAASVVCNGDDQTYVVKDPSPTEGWLTDEWCVQYCEGNDGGCPEEAVEKCKCGPKAKEEPVVLPGVDPQEAKTDKDMLICVDMDQGAANTFSYAPADPGHILGRVGLKPSMYHRNSNMMMARWRYRDALTHRWSLLQLVEHDSRRTALRHRSS